jgi:DNA-binding MarR family transcriptional regulator
MRRNADPASFEAHLPVLEDVEYDSRRAIGLISDRSGSDADMQAMVAAAGARISVRLSVSEGLSRMASRILPAALFIDTRFSAEPVVQSLIDRLRQDVPAPDGRIVLRIGRGQIDMAAACAVQDAITLLCNENDAERGAAIEWLVKPVSFLLRDISAEAAMPIQLREIRDEIQRLARSLAMLTDADAQAANPPARDDGAAKHKQAREAPSPATEAATLRAMIRARRLRDQFFGQELFADPAWDILLDLMAARLEGKDVGVSSLCIAAAVPPTTALRRIQEMTEAGLLERVADPQDGRRIFVALSSHAVETMEHYMAAMRRISWP